MRDRPFYDTEELRAAGFSSVGANVFVSRKASLYGISGTIGDNVRIDDFTILKGRIEIENHVHIASFCSVSGTRGQVRLKNCSTLANGVYIYTGSDDYRAVALSSSTVPEEFLTTIAGDVTLASAVLIGAHSVILPGATIGEAASVGAFCIIHEQVARGAIVVAHGSTIVVKGYRDADAILAMVRSLVAGRSNSS